MKKALEIISLKPTLIFRLLIVIVVVLILANIAAQLFKFWLGHPSVKGFVPLFNFDLEHNIPSFFSVLFLLFSSLLLTIITLVNRRQNLRNVIKWATLSAGFLYMAYDEAFGVHERLIKPIRALLGGSDLGIFYFAWVIPGIIIVIILAIYYMRFLFNLPTATRINFLIAALLYLLGAIGFELIGGQYAESNGEQNLTYAMIVTVEEALEMIGIVIFIRALLIYISHEYEELKLIIESKNY